MFLVVSNSNIVLKQKQLCLKLKEFELFIFIVTYFSSIKLVANLKTKINQLYTTIKSTQLTYSTNHRRVADDGKGWEASVRRQSCRVHFRARRQKTLLQKVPLRAIPG